MLGAPEGARVTQTGWATGPDEPVVSALHGLYGWDAGPALLRAPQGTAHTRWARVPRLSGRAGGTSVHVCLALLTAEPGPADLAGAVTRLVVDETGVEVVWARDGARSRVEFGPLGVSLAD